MIFFQVLGIFLFAMCIIALCSAILCFKVENWGVPKYENPPPPPIKKESEISQEEKAHEALNIMLRNKNVPKMEGFFGYKLENYSKEDLIRIAEYLMSKNKF
jgi:hypothetical protein